MLKEYLKFIIAIALVIIAHQAQCDKTSMNRKYICPPCYHVADIFDTKTYHADGQCPVCGMNLIEKPLDKIATKPDIHFASGNFQFNSQRTSGKSPITVFYHKPRGYTPNAKILLVIPGAGRNAWRYRDSWVALSEKYNVLIVSPSYPEDGYDYAAYHHAGIVSDIEFINYTVSKANGRVNKYHVADKDVITGPITSPNLWLFQDFDDMFDQVVALFQSKRQSYDIFGHSAGGQILHRLAIFYPSTKVDRIIASNAGSYTLPSIKYGYPLGIKGIKFQENTFKEIFSRKLTLLVGELDNAEEKNGTLLHTPILDKQGLGRLSRGKYFYKESMSIAREIDTKFEWRFCRVEGVGHENKKMAIAAAKLLYSSQRCVAKMSI